MQLFTFIGAVLLALLVMLLPALAHKQHWNVIREDWRYPLRLVCGVLQGELGAVTVTYYARNSGGVTINGSATPPTGGQASQVYKQSALVVFGVTADAQALFTHNWGLDGSAPGYYEPEVSINPISTTTYYPCLTFDFTNTNVVKVNKAATDMPTTLVVTLRRPHSVGQ